MRFPGMQQFQHDSDSSNTHVRATVAPMMVFGAASPDHAVCWGA